LESVDIAIDIDIAIANAIAIDIASGNRMQQRRDFDKITLNIMKPSTRPLH
jgi:hypothetical protein